jgi:putative proteasome-type protease
MSYCLGIKTKDGLVGLADTRITAGSTTTNAKKLFVSEAHGYSLFLMTSGLRSVRDKALIYYEEVISHQFVDFDFLYQAVNAFGQQIRRVAKEDKEILVESGLAFNIHTIVGGQFKGDKEHKLFLIYPEGNWIEITDSYPFVIIGNADYGKPIINRTLSYESSMEFALKVGFLSFDSTRVSANDVGFPIDVVLYEKNKFKIKEKRYFIEDTEETSKSWGEKLVQSVHETPASWADELVSDKKLTKSQ